MHARWTYSHRDDVRPSAEHSWSLWAKLTGYRQPVQPWYNHLIVRGTLSTVAFVQKWFMLPRSNSNVKFPIKLELSKNKDGSINPRMHPTRFQVRPWYKPESKTIFGKAWDRFLVLVNYHSHVPSAQWVIDPLMCLKLIDSDAGCIPTVTGLRKWVLFHWKRVCLAFKYAGFSYSPSIHSRQRTGSKGGGWAARLPYHWGIHSSIVSLWDVVSFVFIPILIWSLSVPRMTCI